MISNEKKSTILAAAQSWAGTPFRKRTEIIGVGADCVHLAHGIMRDAGYRAPAITVEGYPLDWAKHRDDSLVVAWLEQSGVMVRMPEGTVPQAGDLLCVKQGRCSHHVALMIDERQFIHTQPGRFAEYGIIDDSTFEGLLEFLYRHIDAQ